MVGEEMCLLDQLAELLFEAVQHARLGHADGRGTDPQASGDLGRGMPLDGREPERPPGLLGDLAADQLQHAPPEGFQLERCAETLAALADPAVAL